MRQLLYVPIIHSEADMGRVGEALERRSIALLGPRRWTLHQQTVGEFWDSVSAYLTSLDVPRLKVYQDGLPAGGEVGERIVQEAARRGSRNYRLILDLLRSGAKLRKTEDPVLLQQEQHYLVEEAPRIDHQQLRRRLLEERDRSIAETINTTLQEGELGALFIGAQHQVTTLLAGDISVRALKDAGVVLAYFEELFLGHDDHKLEELAHHLACPETPAL